MTKKIKIEHRDVYNSYGDYNSYTYEFMEGETYSITSSDEYGTYRTKNVQTYATYDKHGNFNGNEEVRLKPNTKETFDSHGNFIGTINVEDYYEVTYQEYSRIKNSDNPYQSLLQVLKEREESRAAQEKIQQARRAEQQARQIEAEKKRKTQVAEQQAKLQKQAETKPQQTSKNAEIKSVQAIDDVSVTNQQLIQAFVNFLDQEIKNYNKDKGIFRKFFHTQSNYMRDLKTAYNDIKEKKQLDKKDLNFFKASANGEVKIKKGSLSEKISNRVKKEYKKLR